MFYLDTNVWVGRWKPDDAHHAACRRIVEAVVQGTLEGATSVLTLVEAAAAFARHHGQLEPDARRSFPLERYVGEQTRRLMALPLTWIHLPGDLDFGTDEAVVPLPSLLREALALAPRTPRRTLDLLHLAAARYGRRVLNLPLEVFVTADDDLLAATSSLRRIVGLPMDDPSSFAEASEA